MGKYNKGGPGRGARRDSRHSSGQQGRGSWHNGGAGGGGRGGGSARSRWKGGSGYGLSNTVTARSGSGFGLFAQAGRGGWPEQSKKKRLDSSSSNSNGYNLTHNVARGAFLSQRHQDDGIDSSLADGHGSNSHQNGDNNRTNHFHANGKSSNSSSKNISSLGSTSMLGFLASPLADQPLRRRIQFHPATKSSTVFAGAAVPAKAKAPSSVPPRTAAPEGKNGRTIGDGKIEVRARLAAEKVGLPPIGRVRE